MTFYYDTFSTPVGEFSVAVNATGALAATAFGPLAALEPRLRHPGAMHEDGLSGETAHNSSAFTDGAFATVALMRKPREIEVHLLRNRHLTSSATAQLLAYFAGERHTFSLPLAPCGTGFQRRVWAALLDIPFGETRSYGELAEALDRRGSARAVGRANATNPICLVVPCHRVIGADRSLTGFAFGESIKRWLLAHEGVELARAGATRTGIDRPATRETFGTETGTSPQLAAARSKNA